MRAAGSSDGDEEKKPEPENNPGRAERPSEVQEGWARSWLMRVAAAAAPKPLSMLTTVTPAAQLFSMESSAASPPKDAP